MNKIPVVAVVGPTASGKTALAVAIAKRYNGEIVSADSMQIYKKMSIGTAKPTLVEMEGVPHHLLDMIELSQKFSVADYVKLAHEVIYDIHSRGKLPILAGGTGLYVNSLLDDMQFTETLRDNKVREKLTHIAQTQGVEELYTMLCALDLEEAQCIDRYNGVRLMRAIEVCLLTGDTMTAYKKRNRSNTSRYRSLKIGITYESREELYQRINQRVDCMLQNGLLAEAKEILQDQAEIQTAMQAIGYKELAGYFANQLTLEEATQTIKQESRRYAKRQLTWFKRDDAIHWFYKNSTLSSKDLEKIIYQDIDNFLSICYD